MDNISTWQERMKQQEKMASLGLLSAGIAHEIQNPLNFVINFSKMSKKLIEELNDILQTPADQLTDDDRADIEDITSDLVENLSKIEEHGERAISIIRGILLSSRGKEGERIPTDICHIVKEYVWLGYHAMRAAHKGFNVTIHESYQEGMNMKQVVPQDISRVVLNLASNAFYAMFRKGQVMNDSTYSPTLSIDVREEDGKVVITVADNGEGMTEEVRERIFETFFTTKPSGQGTGLGMGIVKDIVERVHSGVLSFETVAGEGTTFTVRLGV